MQTTCDTRAGKKVSIHIYIHLGRKDMEKASRKRAQSAYTGLFVSLVCPSVNN